jgi:fructose-1,6-bisphosphatase/inositol monophosphatase family enzyme
MKDTKTIHFLKEFPAWCVLLAVFVFVFIYYVMTHDGFIQRLVDAAMGALFTALVSNRPKPSPSITTGDDAQVAENLTVNENNNEEKL